MRIILAHQRDRLPYTLYRVVSCAVHACVITVMCLATTAVARGAKYLLWHTAEWDGRMHAQSMRDKTGPPLDKNDTHVFTETVRLLF